jgi:arsenite methyltransferase
MTKQTIDLRDQVRRSYAAAATAVRTGTSPRYCGVDTSGAVDEVEFGDGFGGQLYDATDRDALPTQAVAASLGCGNPLAVADLHEGETVLDLGSGGGIDGLLSARRVGPAGKVYGLDMTDEMLALARANAAQAGATNVEFLHGAIKAIPLPDGSINVIIFNCVINLSTDKPTVFAEVFRVLTPGGRLGVLRHDRRRPPQCSPAGRTGQLCRLHRRDPERQRIPQRPGRRLHRHHHHAYPPGNGRHALRDHPRHQARHMVGTTHGPPAPNTRIDAVNECR